MCVTPFCSATWSLQPGSGNVIQRYLQSSGTDQPLAEERIATPGQAGQVVWLLADRQGTIRDAVLMNPATNTATSGLLAAPRFTYTAREWDTDANLYYYRARWYDPSTGRFISQDPLKFNSGDSNFYRYCGNNPANLTDPTGQSWLSKHFHKATGIHLSDVLGPPSWLTNALQFVSRPLIEGGSWIASQFGGNFGVDLGIVNVSFYNQDGHKGMQFGAFGGEVREDESGGKITTDYGAHAGFGIGPVNISGNYMAGTASVTASAGPVYVGAAYGSDGVTTSAGVNLISLPVGPFTYNVGYGVDSRGGHGVNTSAGVDLSGGNHSSYFGSVADTPKDSFFANDFFQSGSLLSGNPAALVPGLQSTLGQTPAPILDTAFGPRWTGQEYDSYARNQLPGEDGTGDAESGVGPNEPMGPSGVPALLQTGYPLMLASLPGNPSEEAGPSSSQSISGMDERQVVPAAASVDATIREAEDAGFPPDVIRKMREVADEARAAGIPDDFAVKAIRDVGWVARAGVAGESTRHDLTKAESDAAEKAAQDRTWRNMCNAAITGILMEEGVTFSLPGLATGVEGMIAAETVPSFVWSTAETAYWGDHIYSSATLQPSHTSQFGTWASGGDENVGAGLDFAVGLTLGVCKPSPSARTATSVAAERGSVEQVGAKIDWAGLESQGMTISNPTGSARVAELLHTDLGYFPPHELVPIGAEALGDAEMAELSARLGFRSGLDRGVEVVQMHDGSQYYLVRGEQTATGWKTSVPRSDGWTIESHVHPNWSEPSPQDVRDLTVRGQPSSHVVIPNGDSIPYNPQDVMDLTVRGQPSSHVVIPDGDSTPDSSH